MSEWKEYKLEELCTNINYGYTASANDLPVGPKFLRITDIVPQRVNWETVPYCEIKKDAFEKNKLENGDIVIARTGATTGYNYMFKGDIEAVFASYLIRYRINKDLANPNFINYLLKSVNWKRFVEGIIGGSAQPGANAKLFGQFEIKLPPLSEQTAIAEVLSSLDDKIDLLHRQNKTLEQLAETLFRKWFMEDEKSKTKNEKLGNVIKTSSGGTPSRSKMEYYSIGTIRWVKSKELSGSFIFDTEEMITEDALKNSSAKLLPANSILIAMYGATVGEFAILADEATCNQAICALIPNEDYPYTYLFLLTKINKDNLLNIAVGSAQQNISQLLIKELDVSGHRELIQYFHNQVESLFQKIKSNTIQIQTLTRLRDILLPKLMSGEIRLNH